MSASGDDEQNIAAAPTSDQDEGTLPEYQAMVREHRKKRRDVKMTGRPPGTATRILGRPAIFGDSASNVSQKSSAGSPELADLIDVGREESFDRSRFHRVMSVNEIAEIMREQQAAQVKQPQQLPVDEQEEEPPPILDDVDEASIEEEISHQLFEFFRARQAAKLEKNLPVSSPAPASKSRWHGEDLPRSERNAEPDEPVKEAPGREEDSKDAPSKLRRRSLLPGVISRKALPGSFDREEEEELLLPEAEETSGSAQANAEPQKQPIAPRATEDPWLGTKAVPTEDPGVPMRPEQQNSVPGDSVQASSAAMAAGHGMQTIPVGPSDPGLSTTQSSLTSAPSPGQSQANGETPALSNVSPAPSGSGPADVAKDLLAKYDFNKDGVLSQEELAAALQDQLAPARLDATGNKSSPNPLLVPPPAVEPPASPTPEPSTQWTDEPLPQSSTDWTDEPLTPQSNTHWSDEPAAAHPNTQWSDEPAVAHPSTHSDEPAVAQANKPLAANPATQSGEPAQSDTAWTDDKHYPISQSPKAEGQTVAPAREEKNAQQPPYPLSNAISAIPDAVPSSDLPPQTADEPYPPEGPASDLVPSTKPVITAIQGAALTKPPDHIVTKTNPPDQQNKPRTGDAQSSTPQRKAKDPLVAPPPASRVQERTPTKDDEGKQQVSPQDASRLNRPQDLAPPPTTKAPPSEVAPPPLSESQSKASSSADSSQPPATKQPSKQASALAQPSGDPQQAESPNVTPSSAPVGAAGSINLTESSASSPAHSAGPPGPPPETSTVGMLAERLEQKATASGVTAPKAASGPAAVIPIKLEVQPRVQRYSTELIMAGIEVGIKAFTDSYGRQIEAYYSKILTLPDQVYVVSQDGQFAQGFQLCEGEQYWGARHEEDGSVVARMVLDPGTGVIVGENLLTGSLLRLELDGDRIEQVRTPAGMKETIYFADEKNAKLTTGNPKLSIRYCEFTVNGWLIRRDDYLNNGISETCFFDANMRIPNPERRLRAITRVTDRNGIKEKTHEEFSYHAEKHEAVRTRGIYTDAAGKVTDMHFIPGEDSPTKIKITDSFGFTTQLFKNSTTRSYEGTCSDRSGNVLEDVSFDGKTLMYRRRNSKSVSRTEQFCILASCEQKVELVQFSSAVWNPDMAASVVSAPTGARRLRYPTGRVDVIEKDGTVKWEGDAGERSFAAPGGEVLVTNADGGAIRLHRNYTIELKEGIGGKFEKGMLTAPEQDFLNKHRAKLDMRDFAEFSRQWHSRPDKLESVLRQLDYLVLARYREVPPEQVEIVRNCILHHIAYPDEIFQGHATTSGAAVVQRLFATDAPFRYAAMVKEALTGRLSIAGSIVIDLDLQNLLADDLSGRDIASRLFQTMAERIGAHPEFEYRNGWSGIGEDAKDRPGLPLGHKAEDICNLVHRLSGIETSIVEISSVQDLRQAYSLSGGGTGKRTMIIGVDGNEPPFGYPGQANRQLVTVMGVLEGRAPRFLISNQFGAELDHSTRKTAIDARAVVESMIKCGKAAGERVGLAIVHGGQHGQRYRLQGGKLTKISS